MKKTKRRDSKETFAELVGTPEWDYAQAHTSGQGSLLYALERETNLKVLSPQMLSGPFQGQLLQFISKMLRPKRILEIGTFTGYASLCLARGLQADGILHTIEINEELAWFLKKYAALAGISHQIVQHIGDAKVVIPTIDERFDLVFMDAAKLEYQVHYELILEKMNPGGILLADNILWYGKIVLGATDETTETLRQFNAFVQADIRVENILLPLRDGLMMVRKL